MMKRMMNRWGYRREGVSSLHESQRLSRSVNDRYLIVFFSSFEQRLLGWGEGIGWTRWCGLGMGREAEEEEPVRFDRLAGPLRTRQCAADGVVVIMNEWNELNAEKKTSRRRR